MGHGLNPFTNRNGGAKMPIVFTVGAKRPKDIIQEAKLSSECGIHIRSKMPLAAHWKEYSDKDSGLTSVIPDALKCVAVSVLTSSLAQCKYKIYFTVLIVTPLIYDHVLFIHTLYMIEIRVPRWEYHSTTTRHKRIKQQYITKRGPQGPEYISHTIQ